MKNLIQKIRQPKILRVLIGILFIAIVTASYVYIEKTRSRIFIDDSLVYAPVTTISPTSAATLSEIAVYEGETVKKGDPIAIVGGQTLFTDTDGLVSMANNQLGSLVTSTTPVAQIVRTSDMRIAGTLDENKGLNDIRIGQVASFTIDALPNQTFWGYVDEISPSAKQTQLTFSISSERPTQQFVIYARFNAAAYPAIKNGMSAKMTVYTNTK